MLFFSTMIQKLTEQQLKNLPFYMQKEILSDLETYLFLES